MIVQRRSPLTGKVNSREIAITQEQLLAWQSGALIQNVMPNVSADDREFIMSGYTPEDWKKMYPEDDA